MTSAYLPEFVQGVYKNWVQFYSNNLIQEKAYDHYALAADESNDTKRNAQLVCFQQ
jgi:hypothetical protein